MTKLNMSSLKKQKAEDTAREAIVAVTPEPAAVIPVESAPKADSPKARISLAGFKKEPEKVTESVISEPVVMTQVPNTAEIEAPLPSTSLAQEVTAVEALVTSLESEAKSEPAPHPDFIPEAAIVPIQPKEYFPNLDMGDADDLFKDLEGGIIIEAPKEEGKTAEISLPEPTEVFTLPQMVEVGSEPEVTQSAPALPEMIEFTTPESSEVATEISNASDSVTPLEQELPSVQNAEIPPAKPVLSSLAAFMNNKKRMRFAGIFASILAIVVVWLVVGTSMLSRSQIPPHAVSTGATVVKPKPVITSTPPVASGSLTPATATGGLTESGATNTGVLDGTGILAVSPWTQTGVIMTSTGAAVPDMTTTTTGSTLTYPEANTTVNSIRTPNVHKPR